jgi:hypothetical protein
MSETTTQTQTTAAEQNDTAAVGQNGTGKRKGGGEADKRHWATEAEARAAGPREGCKDWKLWCVTGPRGGKPVYLWASWHGMATIRGAGLDGYSVVNLDAPAPGAAEVEAGLARMTDEDRAILLAKYMPAPAAPAPAPAGKGGKGKKE